MSERADKDKSPKDERDAPRVATRGPRNGKARVWLMIGLAIAFIAVSCAYFVVWPLPA